MLGRLLFYWTSPSIHERTIIGFACLPFKAEIDAFDLSRRTANEQSVFDSDKTYRDFIKYLSGVRIFRDGFGVRVDYFSILDG